MRRAPIVVAATAAGLAGVLGFHTQQPSLLSGLSGGGTTPTTSGGGTTSTTAPTGSGAEPSTSTSTA